MVPLGAREITPDAIMRRLSASLSSLLGPNGWCSYAEAARLTGIKERTLRAYVEGTACPNLARYGRLLRVFGPEVGRELAIMLGWQPRASGGPSLNLAELNDLREDVSRALRAVEQVQKS